MDERALEANDLDQRIKRGVIGAIGRYILDNPLEHALAMAQALPEQLRNRVEAVQPLRILPNQETMPTYPTVRLLILSLWTTSIESACLHVPFAA